MSSVAGTDGGGAWLQSPNGVANTCVIKNELESCLLLNLRNKGNCTNCPERKVHFVPDPGTSSRYWNVEGGGLEKAVDWTRRRQPCIGGQL